MKASRVSLAAGVLLGAATIIQAAPPAGAPVLNSTSLSIILASAPKCSISCVTNGLAGAGCTFAEVQDCMCTNITLQAQISKCVQMACVYTDQLTTVRASQMICHGYPIPDHRRFNRIPSIVLPAITVLTVALRCISRRLVSKQLWWDDWTALVAMLLVVVSAVLTNIMAHLGFGLHYWNVNPNGGRTILKLFYVKQMLYIFALVCAKVSMCAFYYRVFSNPRFRLVAKFFFVFMIGHAAIYFFVVVFQCLPVEAIWDRSVKGHCLNISLIGYTGAGLTILEDVILVLMPIPELMKLKLGVQKKLGLVLMFTMGSFASIATMVRLKYLVSFSHTFDSTWDNVHVVLWSAIELNIAITCGSLPALRPLLKKLPGSLDSLQSTWRRSPPDGSSSNSTKHSRNSTPATQQTQQAQRRHSHTGTSDSVSTPERVHFAEKSAADAGSRDDLERAG